MPVSAVLADDEIMLTIKPGEHGSTFGGNPLACAVAMAALQVVVEEDLSAKAREMGEWLRQGLRDIASRNPIITLVRGRGLLNAIVIDDTGHEDLAWDICMALRDKGLLAKPTHTNKIRLAPPLVITKEEIQDALNIIEEVLWAFRK
jgi:ornithine--oxo-acid transaminase